MSPPTHARRPEMTPCHSGHEGPGAGGEEEEGPGRAGGEEEEGPGRAVEGRRAQAGWIVADADGDVAMAHCNIVVDNVHAPAKLSQPESS